MVKIYLLTAWYPFRKTGESFLIPELDYLNKREEFDVTVVAVNPIGGKTPDQFVPEKMRAISLFSKKFSTKEKTSLFIKMIGQGAFWKEIQSLRRKGILNISNVRKLVSFYCRSLRIANAMEQQIKHEDGKIVLYSYWMSDTSFGAALLNHYPNVIAITRTHGGDLYEERNNGYLPMRRTIIENMNMVAPISNIGTNYLIQRNGYYTNIKTFHLGTANPYGQRFINEFNVFRIVSCSYMVPLKRVKMIAEAIVKLDSEKVEWVHFGDGPDFDEIKSIIENTPTKSKCILMGEKKHDDILEYYHNNDIYLFVNVSTSEGIPVSIIEAMSFGIPVLATDVGGTKELVINNSTGFLLPAEIKPVDLAQEIQNFMNIDHNTYSVFRKNAFQMWKDNYNYEINYKCFYDEIIDILR